MKKRGIAKALAALLLISLLLLSGCGWNKENNDEKKPGQDEGSPSSADQKQLALDAAQEARAAFAKADSYRETVLLSLRFPLDGVTTDYTVKIETDYTSLRSDEDFACSRQTSTAIRQAGSVYREEESSGYFRGVTFLSDGTRKLYSETDAERYRAELGADGTRQNFLSELNSAEGVTCTVDESGTRRIVFTGTAGERVEELRARFAGNIAFAGATVTGAETTVRIDRAGIVESSLVRIFFDKEDLTFTVETGYSEYDRAAVSLPDLSGYRKTGDLLLIDDCAAKIYDLSQKTDLSFSCATSGSRTVNGKTSEISSEATVEAKEENGVYLYRYIERIDGVTFDRYYTAGKEITDHIADGDSYGTHEERMTDAEAKAKIAALANAGQFSLAKPDRVEQDGGRITFECLSPDGSLLPDEFLEIDEAYVSYTFVIEDGKIRSLEYFVSADGIIKEGSLSMEQTTIVTF